MTGGLRAIGFGEAMEDAPSNMSEWTVEQIDAYILSRTIQTQPCPKRILRSWAGGSPTKETLWS
eukprot:10415979-Prorocentrum_lima.AAC.1